MPQFVFIQAIVTNTELDAEGPGAISFRHCVVEARDADEAYALGPRVFEAGGIKYRPDVETINDYVVEV